MGRQLRKGENISDARRRWRLERLQQKISEKEQNRKMEKPKPKIMVPPAKAVLPPPIDYIPGDKKLSILICSIKSREKLLQNLIEKLEKQITDDVEILVEVDNGKITTGAKRNILLGRARGDYITFVDDDDSVSDDYVSKILGAIKTSPDCCGIEGEITHMKKVGRGRHAIRKRFVQKFIHSIQYDKWFEHNGVYYRCPNHLNPVRREIALQIMFLEKNRGEDKDFSMRLKPFLKVEEYINGVIYFYKAS